MPPQTHILSADVAALAWLVEAGCDTLVGEAPRNWLSAPLPPQVTLPPAAPRPSPAAAPRAPATNAAAAEAAAGAADIPALTAAVAGFAHPLRLPGSAPQLIEGNLASGLLVLADMPDPPGSPAALLLERMLAAIGLDAARGHLLPWPTPGGRPPRDEEIAGFSPFAARAHALLAPRLVLALGDRAAALSGQARGVAALRGTWHSLDGVPMLVTFHPRRLLSQPDLKRLAWADLQAFAARLESLN